MRCLVYQERVSQESPTLRPGKLSFVSWVLPGAQTQWQELIYTALRLEACSSGRGRLLQSDGSLKTRLAELLTHETGRLLKRYLWLPLSFPTMLPFDPGRGSKCINRAIISSINVLIK